MNLDEAVAAQKKHLLNVNREILDLPLNLIARACLALFPCLKRRESANSRKIGKRDRYSGASLDSRRCPDWQPPP